MESIIKVESKLLMKTHLLRPPRGKTRKPKMSTGKTYTCKSTLIILSMYGTQAQVVCVLKAPPVRDDHAYCLLPTACCLLPVAYCLLPIACCLLPIAYCLLPTAYCLLPIAYCLSPMAYCQMRGTRANARKDCWPGAPGNVPLGPNHTPDSGHT